jgi:formylglycine-generating enzyme required for sulfatase activity
MKTICLIIALAAIAAAPGSAVYAQKAGPDPYAPGETFTECRNCPEMVVIPAGSFIMGSKDSDPNRQEDELLHRVTIARPFAVAATEVTWNQWEACVTDGHCDGYAVESALRLDFNGEPNGNYVDFGRGKRPVVGISWYDAIAYVGWLNRKTGNDDQYRLLTDAEWEYIARAGTETIYPWGDTLDYDYGNFGTRDGDLGGLAEGRDRWVNETAPVASFPSNAFGLYDVQGNVFEWLQDCYQVDLSDGPFDGSANLDGDCKTRMFRSGTFLSHPPMHRAGNRSPGYVPTTRGRNYLGMRVAKTLDQ